MMLNRIKRFFLENADMIAFAVANMTGTDVRPISA